MGCVMGIRQTKETFDSIGGAGGSASLALQSGDSPPPPLRDELKNLSRIPSSSSSLTVEFAMKVGH